MYTLSKYIILYLYSDNFVGGKKTFAIKKGGSILFTVFIIIFICQASETVKCSEIKSAMSILGHSEM